MNSKRIRQVTEHQNQHFGKLCKTIAAMITDCDGYVTDNGIAVLDIGETLPHNNDCRIAAVNDHWIGCVQAAIDRLAEKAAIPKFDMAMVGFQIVKPKNTNNIQLWDASNRALNLVINNLKGVFFRDDNIEHMAFSVFGCWGDVPQTKIYIGDFHKNGAEITEIIGVF
jgi:hypothetical protein